MNPFSSGLIFISRVASSTIGAEKYAPPTDGRRPIRRGIDTITVFLFLNIAFTAVIIPVRTSCSLSISSKILIKDSARISFMVTALVTAALNVAPIETGDIMYIRNNTPEAISITYPILIFFLRRNNISPKINEIFIRWAFNNFSIYPVRMPHHVQGLHFHLTSCILST